MKVCPYCGNSEVKILLSIEKMPNFLSAIDREKLKYIKYYPYELSYCNSCYLGFNSKALDQETLASIYRDYEYISPSKGIGSTKYTRIIGLIRSYCEKNERIVEIGSGDGYILSTLKSSGYNKLTGVEPSPQSNICNGLEIINDFYDDDLFEDNSIDNFVLIHVLEHFQNPFQIIKSLFKKLKNNGKIIIEVPNFSGFHHQHLFYFTDNFFLKFTKENGIKIVFLETDENFDALRIVLSKTSENEIVAEKDSNANYMFNVDRFIKNIEKLRNILLNNGKTLFWGTGSTAVLYLSAIEIDYFKNKDIKITDSDKSRYGKILPYLNLEVSPSEKILENFDFDIVIILSSFYNEIISSLERKNIKNFKHEIIV